MTKSLWVINLIVKGLFTLLAAKYLEPKIFVTLMSIFVIQEGFFALIKAPVDMFLMRQKNLNIKKIWSINLSAIIVITFSALILVVLEIDVLNIFIAIILAILKLPFLLWSKIEIIKGNAKKSFSNVFWSDSAPLICMTLALLFNQLTVNDLILVNLCSLAIILLFKRRECVEIINISVDIVKDFLLSLPKTTIYGVSIAYWLSAERLVVINIFSDETLMGYLFLSLRISSMFVSTFFGYFSTINYSLIITGNTIQKKKLIKNGFQYYIFICMFGILICNTIAEPILLVYFPQYEYAVGEISLTLLGIYIASFNLLLFLFIFLEKIHNTVTLTVCAFILYSSLLLSFIIPHSINYFYFIITFTILILCAYIGFKNYNYA